MPKGRDDDLRAILPPLDGKYNCGTLDETETRALEAALGDGFGAVGAFAHEPMPVPSSVKSGLTRHSYFVDLRSEYDFEEWSEEFWRGRDDSQPPYEQLPLRFVLRRLRLYFANQIDRFCAHLAKEPDFVSADREDLELTARQRLYQKPWYELHALDLISWIEDAREDISEQKRVNIPALLASDFSGALGRLAEQYYWKFRYEKAAITGIAIRAGASSGGKAKAVAQQSAYALWRQTADEIWLANPELSKNSVAQHVKRRLRAPQTTKHIARSIRRPAPK